MSFSSSSVNIHVRHYLKPNLRVYMYNELESHLIRVRLEGGRERERGGEGGVIGKVHCPLHV